jgi:FKBP-type peptidyl-prolyl cis-trans isomerase FkpA
MSEVTQVPLQPLKRGSLAKLWLGILLLVAAALALAWIGAGSMRGETTATGITFRTVAEGQGPLVQAEDVVLIDYVGTLDDGTVFDSSQGQPRPMTPLAVIPGFAEALRKMQKGGQYKFRLPPELAYGDQPPPGIPAGSALNFEVTVADLAPGMGPMLLQQAQQQAQQQQPGL